MTELPDHVDRIQQEWRRERPDVDLGSQAVIGRLHRIAGALTQRLCEVYAAHGLSEAEFDLLCSLRRAGGACERQPVELARTTMVTTGAITKQISRLEERGLVTREAARSNDARRKIVRLTPEGRRLIDAAFTDHMANEARLVAGLDEAQQAQLVHLLRTWQEALQADAGSR